MKFKFTFETLIGKQWHRQQFTCRETQVGMHKRLMAKSEQNGLIRNITCTPVIQEKKL